MTQRQIPIVVGLGVDIINTARFERLLQRDQQFVTKLAKRVLHLHREYPKFDELLKKDLARCTTYISGSWAAKEALFKTLPPADQQSFQFKNWYRSHTPSGKPLITNGSSSEFLLSISHDNNILIATVLHQKFITI